MSELVPPQALRGIHRGDQAFRVDPETGVHVGSVEPRKDGCAMECWA